MSSIKAAIDRLDLLALEAQAEHAEPLWPVLSKLSPPFPAPVAIPHVWRYERLRPFCVRAASLVGTELAERRVFMLVNPAMTAPHTTDTLYAGLQTILPGEIAPAHRHTPFALRFIIEGTGGFTAVEGERMLMERGDLVLTPSWEWHDHGNVGDRPMIWLDGLDLPLWQRVPASFMEHYVESRYPSEVRSSPSIRKYAWAEMRERLDAMMGRVSEARYHRRDDAAEIGWTVGASALRINVGAASSPIRETASAVFHVYEGTGSSIVGDSTIDWTQGDTFAVPAWQTVTHRNTGDQRVYLFRFDDRPLLQRLGAYRCETAEESSPT